MRTMTTTILMMMIDENKNDDEDMWRIDDGQIRAGRWMHETNYSFSAKSEKWKLYASKRNVKTWENKNQFEKKITENTRNCVLFVIQLGRTRDIPSNSLAAEEFAYLKCVRIYSALRIVRLQRHGLVQVTFVLGKNKLLTSWRR